jgi:solute carrier family 39 (zinc transporter), member 11
LGSLTWQRRWLDGSLGFAAGVMLAASFWSLLAPAIELAQNSGSYGVVGELNAGRRGFSRDSQEGEYAFVPVAVGFLLGAAFVLLAEHFIPANVSLPRVLL